MRLFKTNKRILSLQNDPAAFLKGVSANTAEAARNAFLDIHGKIIATFDQCRVSDEEIWILIEAPFLPLVLSHIDRYVKLSRVQVREIERNVYFDLDNAYVLGPDERAVVQQHGKLIITSRDLEATVSEQDFTAFRLEHGIPLHGVDYRNDFVLNVSLHEFVSFTKGCFLGQEPVSKVYNRSKPTWRLVVKERTFCSEEETRKMTSVHRDAEGRIKGFVFERNA